MTTPQKMPFVNDLMGMTVLGERGQVVIPKDIRDAMKLESGARLVVILHEGNKLMIFPSDQMKEFMQMMTERFKKMEHILNSND